MNKVHEIIQAEINTFGTMSFERFMELALYCPEYGYYEKIEDRIGRKGDFYTSVSVGPLFGELLAAQFAEWLKQLSSRHSAPTLGREPEQSNRLCIVEGGAHDGRLALDILRWLRERCREISAQVCYCVIEPSKRRRAAQRELLAEFLNQVVWFQSLEELRKAFPRQTLRGVIFSNELLDAMPVKVYRWDKGRGSWWEWGVTNGDAGFDWAPLKMGPFPYAELVSTSSAHGAPLPTVNELCNLLPDRFTIEVSEQATGWWRQAADCIDEGWLLTLDYGLEIEEILSPLRSRGTLRSYRQHRLCEDVLADPGERDITAHVNFSALIAAGEERGLKTLGISSQAQFLTLCSAILLRERPEAWNPKSSRQLQTLTHPEHLGRAFRVLIQACGEACEPGDPVLARS
jgi:SAM-dependent MidA family methyltransferase